jgi:hypothetical protein
MRSMLISFFREPGCEICGFGVHRGFATGRAKKSAGKMPAPRKTHFYF